MKIDSKPSKDYFIIARIKIAKYSNSKIIAILQSTVQIIHVPELGGYYGETPIMGTFQGRSWGKYVLLNTKSMRIYLVCCT